MFRTKATLKAGLAALALGGAILASATSAEAGASTGTWRNGMVAGPYGAGYYGRHAYNPAGYGYRPAYGGYRRSHGNGGAVAAGLIGGLALGGLAAAPAYSYPAYSYPAYPAASPSYYGETSVYDAPACYTVRRRFVDAWGRSFVRREQVCD
jgi:hypothetical protein